MHYTTKMEAETSLETPVPISDVPCQTPKLTQALPFLQMPRELVPSCADLCSRRKSLSILQVRVQNLVQIQHSRGPQNLGARSPRRLNFVRWGLIFFWGGGAVRNRLHIVLLKPRILRWLLNFWKMCAPLNYCPRTESLTMHGWAYGN